MNVSQKIIASHLVSGTMKTGEEIGLRIDQTLTQDATGTMAYLQFEAMGVPRVRTQLSVSYVDHNTLQTGFENADDHRFLQSIAAKYGIYFSPAGNGICHQLHLERFGIPGRTLIGSDSHTPTAGGLGMLSFGAGGLDVACAMAGEPFYITMPKIVRVTLKNRLRPWVSAKDVILELLRRLSVKGGRGKIFEFSGPGVATLSVPERATITNMGTELGATTSLFPSDSVTRDFLAAQKRAKDWKKLTADDDALYDEEIIIDLAALEPMIALPHSPDNVKKVSELAGTPVQQVAIGSCTNSSLADMKLVAKTLKGKKIHPNVSLVISPGSRQVVQLLAESGDLADMVASGARLLECACGPCIGMGQAPSSGAVSLRTFNRNFEARSGTKDAKVFLCSPEVAVAAALKGEITDPRKLGKKPALSLPRSLPVDKKLFYPPARRLKSVEVLRGPNIKPLPEFAPLENTINAKVLIRLGDNISTDHILPAGAKILPLRSNLPAISEHTFATVDKEFATRAKEAKSGVVVAGENYGQGSSREHAALAPRYLGVKAVIVKSFARIHLANLINFGILPLTFENPTDFEQLSQGQEITIPDILEKLQDAGGRIPAKNAATGKLIALRFDLTPRQKQILRAGGLLNWIKKNS
ncbi:MAG: aconitate hydratase [Elusimicrobia bacterium RIFOXYA2_FULL_50_26]|nr:MAG: aconitate hydratase [Elusimicrobia bacterium RIFOXYA2_FULL_50_26]